MEPRITKADMIATSNLPRTSEIEATRLSAVRARDAALAEGLLRAARGVAGAVASVFHAVAEWPRRRAVYDQLQSLSDRELADIGLTRGDISHVFDAAAIARPANDTAPAAAAARAA